MVLFIGKQPAPCHTVALPLSSNTLTNSTYAMNMP